MTTGEHPGSREMYDFIAKWEACSILVSKNLRWSRFGLLGIMADYVLSHLQGDIVERSGCKLFEEVEGNSWVAGFS